MQKTTYYNLNIAEGTDIVNPLSVDNPNYEAIDEQMHNNAVAGVTIATELANGTVHAITRQNSECAVLRFIATADWVKGDSATVDGVPVTVLLPDGATLPDRAYVINANVLAVLTGTLLTIYVSPAIPKTAADISYGDSTVNVKLDTLTASINALNKLSLTHANSAYVAENALPIWTKGNICTLQVTVQLTNDLAYNSILFTVPDDVAPLAWSNLIVELPDGKSSTITLNPSTKQAVFGGNNLKAGDWISIHGVWIK